MKLDLVDCRPDPRDFQHPFRFHVKIGNTYFGQVIMDLNSTWLTHRQDEPCRFHLVHAVSDDFLQV